MADLNGCRDEGKTAKMVTSFGTCSFVVFLFVFFYLSQWESMIVDTVIQTR